MPLSGFFDAGTSLTLRCGAYSRDSSVFITWTGPVPNLRGMTVSFSNNITNTLTVKMLNVTHGGIYTCIANNEAGSSSLSAIIFVRPVVMPSVILASNGSKGTLTCQVQNFPISTLRWEKMNNNGFYEVLDSQSAENITFAPIKFGTEGIYQCVVSPTGYSDYVSTTAVIVGMCYAWSWS